MKDKRTLDNNTFASNPGNAALNKWVWFRHNITTVSALTLFLIGSILAAMFIHIGFLLIVGIAIFTTIFYWTRIKEHFLCGDSNGGIVVGVHPTLVAVNTNLTKGYGDFPIVKIIECPPLKNLAIGDRVPTVALYTASTDESLSHWIDFNPVPLSYATDNPEVINLAMQSYPSEQWQQLERQLLELDQPYKAGLYQVDKEQSGWNERSNDTLSVLSSLELESGDGKINLIKIVIGVIIFIAILKVLEFFV